METQGRRHNLSRVSIAPPWSHVYKSNLTVCFLYNALHELSSLPRPQKVQLQQLDNRKRRPIYKETKSLEAHSCSEQARHGRKTFDLKTIKMLR